MSEDIRGTETHKKSNAKLAWIIGVVAFIWFAVSIVVIWQQ